MESVQTENALVENYTQLEGLEWKIHSIYITDMEIAGPLEKFTGCIIPVYYVLTFKKRLAEY